MEIQFGDEIFSDIPESYDDLKLGKFMEIMKIQQKEKTYDNQLSFAVDILSTLIGCDSKYLLQLTLDDINEISNEFEWVKEPPEKKSLKFLEIDGRIYSPRKNAQLTAGEQISIEMFLDKDLNNSDNFHLVLSILLRPSVKKINEFTGEEFYDIQPLESDVDLIMERANLFKGKINIGDVFGLISFFSTGVNSSSSKNSKVFSIRKTR